MKKTFNYTTFALVASIAFVSLPTAIAMAVVGELQMASLSVFIGAGFIALANRLFTTLNF